MLPDDTAPQTPAAPEPQAAPAPPAATAPNPNGLYLWVRDVLIAVVASVLMIVFLYQPVRVEGTSMLPRLEDRDRLFINKFVYHFEAIHRGDVVVFHYPRDPEKSYIKRVIAIPGDRVRIQDGKVYINGLPLDEPYAAFEPAPPNDFRDNFPAHVYSDPQVDPDWWRQMQSLTRNGELLVPAGEYFVMGDNRNHSNDSRYWGFVPRQAIVARPLVIYFSLRRPSGTDVQQAAQQASDDRLGHERDLSARLTGFARWKRIFRVVH